MARCQVCRGLRFQKVLVTRTFWGLSYVAGPPCEACDGSGIENCCEGLRGQPHSDETATPLHLPFRNSST